MAGSEALGIKRLESIVFYVNDIERSHSFYSERVDFALRARSAPAAEARTGETTRIYEAGNCRMQITQPLKSDSASGHYLKRHPDGIAKLIFEVDDVHRTFEVLDERGATIIDEVAWWTSPSGGRLGGFEIATPFGEATFSFVQRADYGGYGPDLEPTPAAGPANRFGFSDFDHVTSNFLTLKPMWLWCKEVLGLEEYWGIEFHTDDVAPGGENGSGLKSIVLWDPHSGVKFANNEPMRPHFEYSQIYLFVMDNHGPGIQHAAITTPDIVSTVTELRKADVRFMHTPGTYYDVLAERLKRIGVDAIDEDIDVLRDLGILVDGKAHRSYLLQIFLQEAAGLYEDDTAGPFFFEIIQRKGDQGFGGGNFRALFESIELEQRAKGRV